MYLLELLLRGLNHKVSLEHQKNIFKNIQPYLPPLLPFRQYNGMEFSLPILYDKLFGINLFVFKSQIFAVSLFLFYLLSDCVLLWDEVRPSFVYKANNFENGNH